MLQSSLGVCVENNVQNIGEYAIILQTLDVIWTTPIFLSVYLAIVNFKAELLQNHHDF